MNEADNKYLPKCQDNQAIATDKAVRESFSVDLRGVVQDSRKLALWRVVFQAQGLSVYKGCDRAENLSLVGASGAGVRVGGRLGGSYVK